MRTKEYILQKNWACFVSSRWQESDVLLCSVLWSMTPFSPSTQNLSFGHLWIDERKAALPKTRIDILRDAGKKKGVWWQHEKYSAWKHAFSSNILYVQCMISFMGTSEAKKNKRNEDEGLHNAANCYCIYLRCTKGRGWWEEPEPCGCHATIQLPVWGLLGGQGSGRGTELILIGSVKTGHQLM